MLILRKTYAIIVVGILLISINGIVNSSKVSSTIDDLDPLVDVTVTVEIQAIRFLEDSTVEVSSINIIKNLLNRKTAITSSEPSLYVKVFINDEEFTSNIWTNNRYIYNPETTWSFKS